MDEYLKKRPDRRRQREDEHGNQNFFPRILSAFDKHTAQGKRRRELVQSDRQDDHRTQIHQTARADSHPVEEAVEPDPHIRGHADLMIVAFPFLAGMDHDELFQDEYQHEPDHDRIPHLLPEDRGNLREHVKKYRAQKNPGAEADDHAEDMKEGFIKYVQSL